MRNKPCLEGDSRVTGRQMTHECDAWTCVRRIRITRAVRGRYACGGTTVCVRRKRKGAFPAFDGRKRHMKPLFGM